MTEITDYDVVRLMGTHGGSFVVALALAWTRGDRINRDKLKAAFPELWEEYRELVGLKQGHA